MKYIQVYPLQISQTMSKGGSYILVMGAAEPPKEVPILIGESEAQAIIMAVEGKQAKRPLTHNLLSNIMQQYMLTLNRVTIDRFDEGIFYSTLHITDGITESQIDSRTSDAVVLSLLQDAKVYMNPSVFEETCMEPGALIDNLPGRKGNATDNTPSIEALEALLHECEENEDYERAQEIMDQINQLKNER